MSSNCGRVFRETCNYTVIKPVKHTTTSIATLCQLALSQQGHKHGIKLTISNQQVPNNNSPLCWGTRSSWAGASLAASHAERCPERGCVLVFPSHSSCPCVLQSCTKNCQCMDATLLFQKFGKVLGTLWNLKSLQEVKQMMWGTGRWEALLTHSVSYTQVRDPEVSPCCSW